MYTCVHIYTYIHTYTGSWSDFTECDASCETGTSFTRQTRTYTVSLGSCSDPAHGDVDTLICNEEACPCNTGFEGLYCDQCADGYYGYDFLQLACDQCANSYFVYINTCNKWGTCVSNSNHLECLENQNYLLNECPYSWDCKGRCYKWNSDTPTCMDDKTSPGMCDSDTEIYCPLSGSEVTGGCSATEFGLNYPDITDDWCNDQECFLDNGELAYVCNPDSDFWLCSCAGTI